MLRFLKYTGGLKFHLSNSLSFSGHKTHLVFKEHLTSNGSILGNAFVSKKASVYITSYKGNKIFIITAHSYLHTILIITMNLTKSILFSQYAL